MTETAKVIPIRRDLLDEIRRDLCATGRLDVRAAGAELRVGVPGGAPVAIRRGRAPGDRGVELIAAICEDRQAAPRRLLAAAAALEAGAIALMADRYVVRVAIPEPQLLASFIPALVERVGTVARKLALTCRVADPFAAAHLFAHFEA